MPKVKYLLADYYLYQMDPHFREQIVISANFKGSRKKSTLRESFIHLHRTCRNTQSLFKILKGLSLFKILKGLSPPDDFSSSNAEIASSTFLGITGWRRKGSIEMYLPLIFFILGWFLYLLTILLIGSDSFND